MRTALKIKQCWNCETNVSLSQENCVSCGVYLSPSSNESENNYNILIPPYPQNNDEELEIINKIEDREESEKKAQDPALKLVIATLLFLFAGSIFLLFTAFMLIFAQNGTLVLSLNADYWYIYLALSMPLLFLGWKGLNSLSD